MTALSVEQSCPPRTSIKLVVALLVNLISHPRRRGPLHRQRPSQWLGSPGSGGPGAWDPVRHAASGRWAPAAPSDSESVHWHCGGTELPRSCAAPGPFEARLQAEADAAGAAVPQPALADPAGKAPTCWPVESRRPGHACSGTTGRTRTDACDGSDVREPANTCCRPMESQRHTRTHVTVPNAVNNYARKRGCADSAELIQWKWGWRASSREAREDCS